jgi:multidrug efflux system membrane fusion protein
VVHVAAAVGGRIIQIAVEENSRVAKGDLLFQKTPAVLRAAARRLESLRRISSDAA